MAAELEPDLAKSTGRNKSDIVKESLSLFFMGNEAQGGSEKPWSKGKEARHGK